MSQEQVDWASSEINAKTGKIVGKLLPYSQEVELVQYLILTLCGVVKMALHNVERLKQDKG